MRNLYIGSGQKNKNKGGSHWKLYMFLFLFFAIVGSALKVSAPFIVEKWINGLGAGDKGYAFSIRDVDLSLAKGQIVLNDVKIFNPKTTAHLLETPKLSIQLSLPDLLFSHDKRVTVTADKIDLILSKDFSSELERIQSVGDKEKLNVYLSMLEGKFGKLNIIEHKEDLSRTILELKDVDLKVKEVSLLSINQNSEFIISSNITEGGKLSLKGKTSEVNGSTLWSINGSLKNVPADIFNKISGDKLPFSFNESSLNAEIIGQSEHGKVSGEISPDIKRLNLIDEKPGIPTQTIARALNDELTFTLPFTLRDGLTLEYSDTFRKLKNYRKSPAAVDSSAPAPAQVTQASRPAKKSFSFWPF